MISYALSFGSKSAEIYSSVLYAGGDWAFKCEQGSSSRPLLLRASNSISKTPGLTNLELELKLRCQAMSASRLAWPSSLIGR